MKQVRQLTNYLICGFSVIVLFYGCRSLVSTFFYVEYHYTNKTTEDIIIKSDGKLNIVVRAGKSTTLYDSGTGGDEGDHNSLTLNFPYQAEFIYGDSSYIVKENTFFLEQDNYSGSTHLDVTQEHSLFRYHYTFTDEIVNSLITD